MRRIALALVFFLLSCTSHPAPYEPVFDVEISRAAPVGPMVLDLYDVKDLTLDPRSLPGQDINLVPSGGFGLGFDDGGGLRLSRFVPPNLILRPAGAEVDAGDPVFLRDVGIDVRGLGDNGDGLGVPLANLDDVTAGLEDPSGAEAWDSVVESPFLDPFREPVSTFSIDVDTASMANVRRILGEGRLPPPRAVRIEEMINAFAYDYPDPEGEDPFSVTVEIAKCPWNPAHRLAHVGLQGRRAPLGELPPRNLVFLLDVSGSMAEPAKLPLVLDAMRLLVEQLGPDDRVGIVTYAGESGVALEPTRGDDRQTILAALDRLSADGSTNAGAGIETAYELARRSFAPGEINRVILASDGDFNVGVTSRDELLALIERERADGIFLTVLGVGGGNLKDSQLEMLADRGNGNYAYLDTIAEARKVLVEEAGGTLVTIAKDVKIQVEWNPYRVGAYRLIGYENRRLAAEDFDDDAKDAGEIGAGHSVTALYEIAPPDERPAGVDPVGPPEDPAPAPRLSGDDLMTLRLRYKEPGGGTSRLLERTIGDPGSSSVAAASDDFRFSAAVAAFGLLLRGSDLRGDASAALARELAHGALGRDPLGHRRAFLDLVMAWESLPVGIDVR